MDSQATIVLCIKVNKVMEISPPYSFPHISVLWHKNGKIDFSNNPIIEIKKKLTFQDVFMYK